MMLTAARTPSRLFASKAPMHVRTLCIAVLLLATSACGLNTQVGKLVEHDKGVADAEKDIAAGDPHYFSGFGRPSMDAPNIDQTTGLPLWGLGCEIDEERGAYADGYNETMLAAFKAGRLRGMTLRHKWLTPEAVVVAFEAATPVQLSYEGETRTESPDGRFTVELAPRFGKPGDTPYVFVIDTDSGERTEMHFVGEPACRIAFIHDGTSMIVRDDQYATYQTFDLERPMSLQTFIDPDRGW